MLFDVKSAQTTLWGLSAKDVIYGIERGQIPLSCQIFHSQKQRWESVSNNPIIARELAVKLSEKPLSFSYNSLFYHWSFKNFLSHQGYFTLMEVIAKLQANEIAKNSLINHPTLQKWTLVNSVPIFSEDSIRCLYQLGSLNGYFQRRLRDRAEAKS